MDEKRRCIGTTTGGRPCSAWAVRGSQPPLCSAHGGVDAALAAGVDRDYMPAYGRARRHDEEGEHDEENSLSPEIASTRAVLRRLFLLLSEQPDLDPATMARLVPLAFRGALAVAQLLRDQRALSGEAADGIAGAIAQALSELSTEWGIDL